MNDRGQALAYLGTPSNACWRWAENGNVLVWYDGTTVAFREEIIAVLERLAMQKLPPFSAVALFLAACRGKVPRVGQIVDPPQAVLATQYNLVSAARRQLTVQVEAELKQLERLHELPADLLIGLIAKPALAEIIFESAKAERHVDATAVLATLREPLTDDELNSRVGTDAPADNVRHVFIIGQGLKAHSIESLRLRLRTALDALPKEAELDLTPAERAQRLLDELAKDTELAGLARAARELMAAIRLPRRLAERDELALGGVSDITNRGPLDRLLLSELAHDDLTLSVRVALNEALYVRREPPVHQPPSALALLLDSGVRLWGLPRVFAASVALAFVAKESQRKTVSVWRAQNTDVAGVNLLSKEGLSAHLEALDTTAHPGAALDEFLQKRESPDKDALPTDVILVTHQDTLADPDFRRAVTEANPTGFIATVNREGAFALHELPLAPRPPLCEAKLDLNNLFTERRSAVRLISPETNPELPAIFHARPFPLLLPVTGKIEHTATAGEFTIAVMSDGRLLRWRNHQQGAQQITTGIPHGQTLWLNENKGGTISLVKWQQSARQLMLIHADVETGNSVRVIPTSLDCPAAVCPQGDALLLIGRQFAEACDAKTGNILGRGERPAPFHHHSQRFAYDAIANWVFASWNGREVVWDRIVFPSVIKELHESGSRQSNVLLVFDNEEAETPLILTATGCVYTLEGRKVFNSGRRATTARVSQDGYRLLVTDLDGKQRHLIDLKKGSFRPCPQNAERALEPCAPPTRGTWTKLKAIRADGVLRLYSPKGGGLRIAEHNKIVKRSRSAPCPPGAIEFRQYPSPRPLGCQLHVAEWPNGSRAFLDSRGMLHLKSHDRTLPEISIVLSEGPMAAWCSDGAFGGPSFFCPGEEVFRAADIPSVLRQFVERL